MTKWGTRIIGYARVSTDDQDLALQVKALEEFGVDGIITDKASGAKIKRKGLDMVFKVLCPGDTLVVWKLDRLGRSVIGVLEAIKRIEEEPELTKWQLLGCLLGFRDFQLREHRH